MDFQWYPGHMTKARRAMQEDIKLVDMVIEVIDARIPISSRNPDIDELGKNKFRLVLLNKADLADDQKNRAWQNWFQQKGIAVVMTDARTKNGMKQIQNTILEVCKEKIERDRRRGIKNRPIRAMVVGIPNVGKSTFINSFAGRSCAKTGNKPGVTRGNQWIRLNKNVELLDTPGILWPKFEDQIVGLHLAFIGSMKDDILNQEEVAVELLHFLQEAYPEALAERYQMEKAQLTEAAPLDILQHIAQLRGCLLKAGELDTKKAAALCLDDFRAGRIGRISVEMPEE
ncbi:MAG: ribosome biogenesis GTPase YlqF [Lachnospiraceae bacterium]|nr:ribosome biogenesis GTPase YlqF [Lachnospiraceae bacterium]